MGMFDNIKQAMQMRAEAKRIQNEMQKITVDYSNGGITCTAKGDMTISSITFAPEAYDEVKAGKPADVSALEPCLDGMVSRGAQAFILGCTELPLVFSDRPGRHFIDPTAILAKAAIKAAGGSVKAEH